MIENAKPKFRLDKLFAMALLTILAACGLGSWKHWSQVVRKPSECLLGLERPCKIVLY